MATTLEPPKLKPQANDANTAPVVAESAPTKTLILGLLAGIVFGFLLQKGGVGKFHVLVGQLLLQDFTVVKIMLSAVVVGMLGIHFMNRWGMVELHIKPTRIASNTIGGLLFGAGFAMAAYCPGTGAAALGQGNFDAFAMIAGMVAGSYLFAEASGWISRRIDPIGSRGELTVDELLPWSRTVVVIGSVLLLTVVLTVLEFTTIR